MEFPALLAATEAASAGSQRTFLVSRATEFASLAFAAGFGAVPRHVEHGVGPAVALIMFVIALVVRLSSIGDNAEKRWYDGRAASESVKSAAWQFASGGEMFALSDPDAASRFLQAQQQVLKALPNLDVPVDANSTAITSAMHELRAAPLAVRTATYLAERVEDQRRWYSSKAIHNGRRARQWRATLIIIEGTACLLGLLRVLGAFDVDWLGLLATVAAGIAAWNQTKNHASLSESYSVTSHELTLLAASMTAYDNERAWAQAVHDAEAAFSREHTLWLARRHRAHP